MQFFGLVLLSAPLAAAFQLGGAPVTAPQRTGAVSMIDKTKKIPTK